jgi:hypothetical protein
MRVYVYKLVHDTGFAPNPFHGWCTLACCKPKIRSTASPGDWVVGVTPRSDGERLAYFMRVEEVLTFEDFFRDERVAAKKPVDVSGQPIVRRCGDNCYEPIGAGEFRQLPCDHSLDGGGEDPRLKRWDLSGRHVLASRQFGYFGIDAPPLVPGLGFMVPGRGHRVNFSEAEKRRILDFLGRQRVGIHGRPRHWPDDDTTWKQRSKCG